MEGQFEFHFEGSRGCHAAEEGGEGTSIHRDGAPRQPQVKSHAVGGRACFVMGVKWTPRKRTLEN